jgi:hypothetical protein
MLDKLSSAIYNTGIDTFLRGIPSMVQIDPVISEIF